MTSKYLLIVSLFVMVIVFDNSSSFGLQSGGVEIGDLETGSVVGRPFNALNVDVTLTALCVGGQKAWYPPTIVLDLGTQGTGGRTGGPILLKVTNALPISQGFALSADSAFAGPTSLIIKIVLDPGETKYVGIPMSDLTYVTAAGMIPYGSHTDPEMLGGQIVIIK